MERRYTCSGRYCGIQTAVRRKRDAEDDDKLHILQEAWLLYRGPLLASNSIEEWAIPENLHYKELYRDCTNQIADILKEKRTLGRSVYPVYNCIGNRDLRGMAVRAAGCADRFRRV